jgi:hypothetical protein
MGAVKQKASVAEEKVVAVADVDADGNAMHDAV